MGNIIAGQEAIAFQINSQLGKDLTELFSEMIVYKNTCINDPDLVITNTKKDVEQVLEQVHSYWIKTGVEKFKKILKKHTNLKIKGFRSSGGKDRSLDCYACINLNINNVIDGIKIANKFTGLDKQSGSNVIYNLKDDLVEIAQGFNKLTGKADVYTLKSLDKELEIPYACIDTNGFFCLDLLIDSSIVKPFTPEEITAIYLHEIGHILSVIEHMADMFYTRERLNEFSVNLSNVPVDKLQETLEVINKEALPVLRESMYNMVDETGDIDLEQGINLISKAADAGIKAFRFSLTLPIKNLFYFLLCLGFAILRTPINIYYAWLAYNSSRSLNQVFSVVNERGAKISDFGNSEVNESMCERMADQFVSRQGYGQHLSSALKKIHDISKLFSVGGQLSTAALVLLGGTIENIKMNAEIFKYFDFGGAVHNREYESTVDRMRRIVEDMYGLFKHADKLPPEIVNEWYGKIKEINKLIESHSTYMNSKSWGTLVGVLKNLTSPINWINLAIDGNLYDDLTRLTNNLDRLSNNSLYMYSARLRNMK